MNIVLEEVLLRPFCGADVEPLCRFRNNPDIVNSLGGFSSGYMHEDIKEWMEYHRNRNDEVMWCIADKKNDSCIGHCGLYQIDHRVRKAELAIMIGEDSSQGRGIGKTVCRAMIDYAFTQLNIRRIELSLLSTNEAAEHLYKRLGFIEEGRQKNAQYRSGQYVDVILMALFRT